MLRKSGADTAVTSSRTKEEEPTVGFGAAAFLVVEDGAATDGGFSALTPATAAVAVVDEEALR
jgi:hypothetical protein